MAGVPVPLVDVRIRGDDGSDAPLGRQDHGRDPGARPVHHRRRTTACRRADDKFTADGWLRTGDVATMDELGFMRITDRTKDLIKSGGEWISSVDLENALMAPPGGRRGRGDRDPRREMERAAAGLRRAQDRTQCDRRPPSSTRTCCEHGFAKWQLPDRYEVIDAVPRTSTGKFWKLKLRERFPR